ncbi:HK97 family phage prohead protease [Nonomuraea sp. NPDC059023]|uniref:HK97 family phage prohead protease n=1 Tax=unclassified Nonomuraea TaxID=2593643 RepID=UPI00368A4F24
MMETLRELDIVRAVTPGRAGEIRATEEGGMPTMVVRFSRFDAWYEIDSYFEGRFLERTVRGAFKKTINENRQNIKVLFDHGYDMQIGNKVLGPIDNLREEDDSPVGDVPLFDTSYNRDLLPGLEAGVYGSSFRFRVIKDEWNDEPGRSESNPDGIPERTIKEVRLFEFGPVTFPANPDSTAGVRCLTDAYYERLRSRDPHRVEELMERARALRTPIVEAAAVGTSDEGAAPDADEPATRHSDGLTPAQRRLRLYPFLTMEGASS